MSEEKVEPATEPTPEPKKPWPRIWEHKQNKKRLRVTPWWECVEPILGSEDDYGAAAVGRELMEGRKFKIGALVQVGWLLENEHGVWFGVGPTAEEAFTDVTEEPAK